MTKKYPFLFILNVVVGFVACATGCGRASPSAAPLAVTVNTGTKELTWAEVQDATSYNVYMKVVAKELGLVEPVEAAVTTNDTKIADAKSPFSLAPYNKCKTAYFFIVTAKNPDGESTPSGSVGYGPSNTDCTP